MLRWREVADATVFGRTVKMYREPFNPLSSTQTPYKHLELDHFAFKHLGSELLMYKILDTNFVDYMEQRGDLDRLTNVLIPIARNYSGTVL